MKRLKIALIGPLPPPSGGMANQTRQLARLLTEEGTDVELVRTNAPCKPVWMESVWIVRALCRLIPFVFRLWSVAGRVQLFHVMANSGWAWHLLAAPAICIAKLRRVPVVVNYRGGHAEAFFSRSLFWAKFTMGLADRLVVPSGFLQAIFERFDLHAQIVPNVIDLSRFTPRTVDPAARSEAPHIIVTRNLEPIYDIATALRALALVRQKCPGAHMTIAGEGPERAMLMELTHALGLKDHVVFTGSIDNERLQDLYKHADLFLNSSVVDNMPNSILEALASGVPIVSTDAGGISFMVEHGKTALLVPPRDPDAMASAALALLDDPQHAARLAEAGVLLAQQYSWPNVRGRLFGVYSALVKAVPAPMVVESK